MLARLRRVSSYGEIAAAITAPPWRVSREATQPIALDVRVAVLLREAEALREVRADGVAVEVLDDEAAAVELGADEVRDRGLARRRRGR